MRRATWLGVLLLAVSVAVGPGCLLLAGAVGGVIGVRELTDKCVIYEGGLKQVGGVVERVIREDRAVVTSKSQSADDTTGRLKAITFRCRTLDDEAMTVDVEEVTPSSTEVEIRVGRIGDKARAREMHGKLQRYLRVLREK